MRKKVQVRVSVEEADIKRGRRNSCARCPVAIALYRALGFRVYVAAENIKKADGRTRGDRGNPIADLPAIGTRFIDAFDAGRNVRPFGFQLWMLRKDIMKGGPAGAEAIG